VQQNENECHCETVKAIGEEVVEMQGTRGAAGWEAGWGMGMQEVVRWRLAAGGAGASSDRSWTARAWSRIGDGVWRGGVELSLAEQDSAIRSRMRWKQWMDEWMSG
jgi:hypothetical protein